MSLELQARHDAGRLSQGHQEPGEWAASPVMDDLEAYYAWKEELL